MAPQDLQLNRPIPVYRFSRRALTLCLQLCMGIQPESPDTRLPARSADALPATLYGHFIQAIYRNRPIALDDVAGQCLACLARHLTACFSTRQTRVQMR